MSNHADWGSPSRSRRPSMEAPSPPDSPEFPFYPASSPAADPILFPNSNPHSSTEEPLFRSDGTHRVVDDHMAARGSRGLGRVSPPRQTEYELALDFKSQVGKQRGTKRRLSESDIRQNIPTPTIMRDEEGQWRPDMTGPVGLNPDARRELSNDEILTLKEAEKRRRLDFKNLDVEEWRSQAAGSESGDEQPQKLYSRAPPSINAPLVGMAGTLGAVPGLARGGKSAERSDHATVKKLEDDSADEEDEDIEEQRDFLTSVEEDPIVPNYEGFKAHVRRLNPNMDSRYNWLVSRIAHQQEIRYKNLLNMRVKHSQAISRRECAAGRYCLALGGSVTRLDMEGKPMQDDKPATNQGRLQLVTDFSDDDSDPGDGALTDETFPQGVPMPPTRNLPAEFECQLCFRAKKFQRPAEWTKHVHEDVQPFTCTYEKCKEPKSFKRKADWVRHENERHRHLEWWICQIDDCRHPCYRKDNFLQHIVREHKLPEPKQKTKGAIKKARLTEPAWIMLEQCHHETQNRPQDEPCKFCGKSFPTWKKLTVHLAKHMEHISLPILRLVEAKNVDANTMISPVEQILSPVTPIAKKEREFSPFDMNSISSHIPTAYTQPAPHSNSGFNPYNPDPTMNYPTNNSNMFGIQQPAYDYRGLASDGGPGMPGYGDFSQQSVSQSFDSMPSEYPDASKYPVPQSFSSETAPDYQSYFSQPGQIRDPMEVDSGPSFEKLRVNPNDDTIDESEDDNDRELRPIDRPVHDQMASAALGDLLKANGGPPVASIPTDPGLVGWWSCCWSHPKLNSARHGTTCPGCGHEKCISCIDDSLEDDSCWVCCQEEDHPECGREVDCMLHGTTCPDCGHLKCNYCDEITPRSEQSSRPEAKQANLEWDVQSLASVNTFHDSALGSSLPSNTSGSLTQGLPKTAQEELLLILFSDQKFRSLLEDAASLISKPRFTRNIRRLLVPFQRELQNAAADSREKDATRILEKHSQWFASRLFDMSDPENKSNSRNMAAHLNQHIDKLPMLERYLASTVSSTVPSTLPGASQPKSTKAPQSSRGSADHSSREEVEKDRSPSPPSGSSDESESDESEIDIDNYIDYSKFPNLEHIKNFIIGGAAFENLKQNTFEFLNPQKPPIPSPKISPEIPSEESLEGSGSTETTEVTIPDFELEEDSDDMASVASDDPALTGASEGRILNPREYFDRLEALERDVFEDCSFLFPETYATAGNTKEKLDLLSSEETFQFQTRIENEDIVRIIKISSSTRVLHLLECYNIIRRTGKSLARLRNAGYLTDAVTFLVMERDFYRRRVAKMVPIPVHKVLNLGLTFEFTLKGVLSELSALQYGQDNRDIVDSIVTRQDGSHSLTVQCEEMLSSMDLSHHLLVQDECPIIWDCAVQALQLGVLSYAGAHIQRFDLELIGSEMLSFQLPIKITYEDYTLQEISSRPNRTVITLRRRQFQCLDKLLGGCHPWVFHQNVYSEDNEPLHLSTSIGSLTDLWGPSWKILGERGSVQRYDIGNGSIVPWSENAEYHSIYSATNPSEIYCHWISSKECNKQIVEANQRSLPRKYLLESDTLLIGANTEFGLNINQGCTSSPEKLSRMKTQLHDQGALRFPRTFRDKRFIDSHAVQVSGTALGIISGTGIVTYKRRVGHTLKDALVERWRHNLRSPLDLEAFSGVEVSFCTRNARRRRLMHLLASDTMRNYLNTISFNWVSEDCEHAYFKALRCPKLFRRFWKDHRDWQENVGNAVSICLDALEETGIDDDSGELSALWVESFDGQGDSDGESDGEDDKDEVESPPGTLVPQTTTLAKGTDSSFCEEHIVTLFRSEHTWTGFLQDSEESLTMAIVGMTCLDFLHENGYGRRCAGQRAIANDTSKSNGFAVLQTSLKLNESILKNEKLKQEKVDSGRKIIWDAKDLKKGTSFPLGNHGTLKVLTGSTRTCPVIAEWSAIKSEIIKEVKNVAINEKMLGRPAERHHCEHIRGSWEAKPLPVLVMSKSTKVIFTKG